MIEHFKLGCANRTLGYRLPDKNRNAGFPCVFVLCAVVFNSNASNMLSTYPAATNPMQRDCSRGFYGRDFSTQITRPRAAL